MNSKKKKILVLTDHMPWGHRSIAKAIYNYLKANEKENNYEVVYAEIEANTGLAGDLYTFAYRYLPKSNLIAHNFFNNKTARKLLEDASILNLSKLKKGVEKIKPDLIISAYFFHSHTLSKWRRKENKNFKLWTVVADPWTVNPISFIKDVDLHLVYDEITKELAVNHDVAGNKIVKTGWWVRPEMYNKYKKEEVRKKLGFYDNRPIIFVGGGSLGTNSLTRILPALLMIKKKVGFIFNTGTDKLSYNLVDGYVKMFKRMRNNDTIIIKNMGWIDNMAEVLSACDMVFGKAGPNFLFDVMATEKPFVSITHIGGQEDGNIKLIKKKKLGWVKEKNGEIYKFLLKYLDDPKTYQNKYKENIKKEAEANKKGLPMILEMVKKV